MAKQQNDQLMAFTHEVGYDMLVFTEIIKPMRIAQIKRDTDAYFKLLKSFHTATSFFLSKTRSDELLADFTEIEQKLSTMSNPKTKAQLIAKNKKEAVIFADIEELDRKYNRMLQSIKYFKKQFVQDTSELAVPMSDRQ